MAAVGLALYAYAFPLVGKCVEVGVPQIVFAVIFSLYLRRVTIRGNRVFQTLAIPLSLGLVWLYAYLLTVGGAYSFRGCHMSSPADTVSAKCRQHVQTMLSCRTDTSDVIAKSAWIHPPYPFHWGWPSLRWESVLIMLTGSIVATLDSVSSYHTVSLLVASRPPPAGVVSRGIGLEGVSSVIAGVLGMGGGATTLTENSQTIVATRIGNRTVVNCGACVLILLSLSGKVGGLLASIPQAIVGGLLCIVLAQVTALGLSTLRYTEMESSRNLRITGLALFLSLSVPSYFSQYTISAGHGPVHTSNVQLNTFLNSLGSLPMLLALLTSLLLDLSVPGTALERGLYLWSSREAARKDSLATQDYGLPKWMAYTFRWATWVGL